MPWTLWFFDPVNGIAALRAGAPITVRVRVAGYHSQDVALKVAARVKPLLDQLGWVAGVFSTGHKPLDHPTNPFQGMLQAR